MYLLLIIVNVVMSLKGFKDPDFFNKCSFHPYGVLKRGEYYRIITSSFLHVDPGHLIFNMITLFFFGRLLERAAGIPIFLLIYFGSMASGDFLSLWLHRHQIEYRAVGASGAVCGIIFSTIVLFPSISIFIMFIPIPVPGWIYAIFFIWYSSFGIRRQIGNIGHDAHLGGAIAGLVLATLIFPSVVFAHYAVTLGLLALAVVALVVTLSR